MTAHDQPDQLNIEDVRDLLSPYLDDEVTAEERALVEQVLADSAELRQELETLRQTVALVAALPQVPAPRPFTLSEADVQVSAPPVARKYFRLPTWARGWAMLAATLLCVLTIGGLFLSRQFGRSTYPAAEIARLEQSAAPPATATSREGVGAAKEEVPAEPAAAEEAAPVEQAAEEEEVPAEAAAEEAAPAEPLVEKEVETVELEVEAEVPAADEAAEDTFSMAGEPTESEVAEQDAGVGGGVTPTASPAPTTAVLATPTAAAEEEEALAEKAAPAPPVSPTTAGEPAQPPETEPGPNLEPGGAPAPRPVEIQNQRVRVTPGLIQIEGLIEVKPGNTLLATLQRNNQPFDQWADPTSLQTVVRANGQFSFTIRAQTGRADKDLFATEPANYQIIITSAAVEEPVVASVFFYTTSPQAATQQPTATSTPTVVARVTFIPTATSTIAPPPIPGVTEVGPSANVPVRLIVTGIVLLGVLIVIGLVVWLIIRKQR